MKTVRRYIYSLLASAAILGGTLAFTAGSASASVTDRNPSPHPSQFQSDEGRFQHDQFTIARQRDRDQDQFAFARQRDRDRRFFCTREDRRLELFLLRQRHLNRFERAELRSLERICDDDEEFFFFTPFDFSR